MAFGATPADWNHFSVWLGLTEDLLPVVSDPTAPISPESKIKQIGKTPSRLNKAGEVSGIAGWTEKQATDANVTAWSKRDQYGICIQTRTIRGLDIDVPDVRIADRIAEIFAENCPGMGALPRWSWRVRTGTGKRLLPFIVDDVEGRFPKQSVRVDGGLVEILGDGQQFIACGTHPSGTRYEWTRGLPDDFPHVTVDQIAAAMAAVREEMGEADVQVAGNAQRLRGETVISDDDVVTFLQEHWPAYGFDRNGALMIDCPWKAGHESDNGPTETVWFPAGTGGYQQGHFKCLHESCRPNWPTFLTAVGYADAQFEDETQAVAELYADEARRTGKELALAEDGSQLPRLPLPGFKRDKQGGILSVIENVSRAVRHVDACGVHLRYDSFIDDLLIRPREGGKWRVFEDADAVKLRIALAGIGFDPVGREMMRDALIEVSYDNRFDSAIDWLEHLPPWDGVPRVDSFLHRYFKVEDRPYHTAVSRYAWTALAGRVMDPGCQADMVPTFVGEQGLLKTSAIRAMAPWDEAFTEFDFADDKTELSRLMRGTLVGELAELQGLQTRAQEGIKAWITKRQEKWTQKYRERGTSFNRRCVLFGSSNIMAFLSDPTGERRWLPVTVTEQADAEAIMADRDQLWAEGLALWREDGIAWRDAERLARAEHGLFRDHDMWEPAIRAWLAEEQDLTGDTPLSKGFVTTQEAAEHALMMPLSKFGKAEQRRIGAIFGAIGLKGQSVRHGKDVFWGFVPRNVMQKASV
jgi:hypothetical protein